MNAKKLPEKLQAWVDIRKKYHLSHMHIQMARELGLNPKKFSGLDNHKQEPWKEPLPVFIKTLYNKSFSRLEPEDVKSIEQLYQAQQDKKAQKKLKQTISSGGDNAPIV